VRFPVSGLKDCFVATVALAFEDIVSRKALCNRSAHARFEPERAEHEPGGLGRQIVDGRCHP